MALDTQAPSIFLPCHPQKKRKPRGHNMAAPPPGFVSRFRAGRRKRSKGEKAHANWVCQGSGNVFLDYYLQVIGQNYFKSPMTASRGQPYCDQVFLEGYFAS